jgi:hypothetical protein
MNTQQEDNRPPLFPKWGYWYALVVGLLILQVFLYHLFTRHFS